MAKILLADDDPRLLPVLALHLRNDDHQVVCAASVEEAIRLAVSAKPDLMVLDAGLTDADGASLQRKVAENQGLIGIPAIYLVEEDMPRSGRAPRQVPASTIHKPVPVGELLEKVQRALSAAAARARPSRAAASPPGRDPGRRSAAA